MLSGRISDGVPQHQTGQANGVLAVLMLTGSLLGFTVIQVISGGWGKFTVLGLFEVPVLL